MSKLKKSICKHYMIFLCFIGVFGSALFLMVGYWSAGAMNGDPAIGFFKKFRNVLREPFSGHYNTYTPIVMVISFIVFEMIYFLILFFLIPVLNRRKINDAEEIQKDKEETSVPLKDEVISSEILEKSEDSKSLSIKEAACFDETLFRELFDLGYSFEQITEMSKLKNYMESVSVDMLVKIFDVTMPAADICSYIELFYE